MKILVAGGAGWIGGITTRLLQEAGHEAVVFDNLSTGFAANVKDAQLIEGDLTDLPAVRKLFAEPFDAVIDFAAKLDVGESMQQPRLYFDNNVSGSLNLIDEAVKAGVKHFIFSSSATVYGEPEAVPITETAKIQPINPYGFSKVMVEGLLQSYGITHGLNWLALRYFNPVGAYEGIGQNPQVSNVIPAALRALHSGQPLKIFGNDYDTPDGTCIRDYVDVKEIATAHILAAEKMSSGNLMQQPINLGSGHGYSVLEILAALDAAVGTQIPREIIGRRAGDAPRSVASNSLAKAVLGWEPATPLTEMVKAAYEHAKNNSLS